MAQRHVTLAQARAALESARPKHWATVFTHGTLEVDIFAPVDKDTQTPHRQDEVYFVLRGSGVFKNGAEKHSFGPGDCMFVPAGTEHCFEEFSADTLIWAALYGPEGGERA